MDGVFSTGGATVGEDHLSKQEMRHKARKLWLGRCLLQLQRMGSSGASHCSDYVAGTANGSSSPGLLHSPIQSRRDCMIGSVPPLFCVVLLSDKFGAVDCYLLICFRLWRAIHTFTSFLSPLTHFSHHVSARGNSLSVFWASVHPRQMFGHAHQSSAENEAASI